MSIVPNWRHPDWQEIQFIKSDGTVYNLHTPPTRAVRSMTGWGKPPETRNEIVGPFQHGNTVVSYRLQPRTISLELLHKYCSRSELYAGRSVLLDQMGLNNASPNAPIPGVLRWRYIEGGVYKIRDLDVYLTRGLGFQPLEGWRHWAVQEGLEFVAPNPVIYDPTTKTGTINSFTAGLTFSMFFPFVLGALYGTTNITYVGTWATHPTIIITGPAAGVYIENRSTGNFLRFNYVVSAGETVTITTVYNNRTVTNNFGQGLLSYISDDSTLGEFTLQPADIVSGGINVLDVYTDGIVAGTTSVVLSYFNRYYGI